MSDIALRPDALNEEQLERARTRFFKFQRTYTFFWTISALSLIASLGIALVGRHITGVLPLFASGLVCAQGAWKLRPLIRQGLNSMETRYVIGQKGLSVETDLNHGTLKNKHLHKWKSFLRPSEIDGALMLPIRSGGWISIPDQCFETPDQRAQLINRIELANPKTLPSISSI